MNSVTKIFSAMAVLIGLYLVMQNYRGTTAIIKTIGSSTAEGVKALQGRG